MEVRYAMVTRSPRGQREIGFMSASGSDVFVSRPVPGKPLPGCHYYADDAKASLAGWRGPFVPFIRPSLGILPSDAARGSRG